MTNEFLLLLLASIMIACGSASALVCEKLRLDGFERWRASRCRLPAASQLQVSVSPPVNNDWDSAVGKSALVVSGVLFAGVFFVVHPPRHEHRLPKLVSMFPSQLSRANSPLN